MSQLDKNLTGEQIQAILDSLLYSALEPVIKHTSCFDIQLVYILTKITHNKKRKMCAAGREKAISLISTALSTTDMEEKFDLIRQTGIERLFIHVFLYKNIYPVIDEYLETYNYSLRAKTEYSKNKTDLYLRRTHKNLMVKKGCSLVPVCVTTKDYLDKYYEFRSIVVEHYVKNIFKTAHNYVKMHKNRKYDIKEIEQNMIKAVLTAIDKYDSRKGALTSYINWWVLNAQTCNSGNHEYGVAYTIPSTQRKKVACKESSDVNYSVSLDTNLTNESSLYNTLKSNTDDSKVVSSEQQSRIISYLSKIVDIEGLARIELDIPEYFSKKEKEDMISNSLKS